jgi:hypothetical protein
VTVVKFTGISPEQVHAVAAEERMLVHVDDDVGWPAGPPAIGLTLADQAQLLTRGDARRDLDSDLPLRATRPAPPLRARLGDDLAGARALRWCATVKALLADLSVAHTAGGYWPSTRRRAGPAALLAGFLTRNLDRRLGAFRRFLEQISRSAEIRARCGHPGVRHAAEEITNPNMLPRMSAKSPTRPTDRSRRRRQPRTSAGGRSDRRAALSASPG